jgi:raffinose/stachyose/melibiose transport system permease protein
MAYRAPIYVVAIRYALLILLCIVIIAPVLTVVLGSLRTTGEFLSTPFGLPKNGILWDNYTAILKGDRFWTSLKNSLYITAGVTILNVSLGSMLAFVFSHLNFPGRGILFNILSFGLLFPLVVATLPIFLQVRELGLINNRWGVILPLVAFGLPGSVVILRGFFMSVPFELEDAAYIDGATTFGFFRYILFPISRPALIAVAVLQVVASWNEYFLPLLVINEGDLKPLPMGVTEYQGQYSADWAGIMAYVTLLIIPAILFYLFAEKYIVTGLTGGELKG